MSPHFRINLPLATILWLAAILLVGRALAGPDAPPAPPQATIGAGGGKPF